MCFRVESLLRSLVVCVGWKKAGCPPCLNRRTAISCRQTEYHQKRGDVPFTIKASENNSSHINQMFNRAICVIVLRTNVVNS